MILTPSWDQHRTTSKVDNLLEKDDDEKSSPLKSDFEVRKRVPWLDLRTRLGHSK